MVFAANPLSLSVPEPAFETWLRDSGYLELLDEHATTLNPLAPSSATNPTSTTTTSVNHPTTSSTSTSATTTTTTTTTLTLTPTSSTFFSFIFSHLTTIFSLITLNPFAKLTTDDFSNETPSWTVGFIGSYTSYSFPSCPSQAKLRVHENVKRYARNYATLSFLFFACSLYQLPVALFGLIGSLALWDLFKWCGERWELEQQYPSVQLSLVRFAQCATGVLLYCSNVQLALFYAVAVSYGVMILHASLRRLSPSKQSTRADGYKWFQQNKNRS